MNIKVFYFDDKRTDTTHKYIDKREIKNNLLYMYRGSRVEVVYNINKIISFYQVD